MKIRNGFVSNSSSSSFVGIGWEFKKDSDFLEMVKKYMTEEEYSQLPTAESVGLWENR